LIPTFVIALREGVEASLIVGIVAAFLKKAGKPRDLRWMWIGVVVAGAICLAGGIGLRAFDRGLPQAQQEGFEAVVSLVAVGTVTWMIVWTKHHARELKGHLEQRTASALAEGTAFALVGMAFFAVLREGFETSVFLLAAFQAAEAPVAAGVGVVLGLLAAGLLGYAIYRGGTRLNFARFFRITGFVLVLVAAGVLAFAAHAAHEAGILNTLQTPVFDISWLVAPGTIRASLLTGMLGLQPQPTQAEVIVWLAYAVPMGLYVLWPRRAPRGTTPAPSTTSAPAPLGSKGAVG
jgi:high-affinity iron transporter